MKEGELPELVTPLLFDMDGLALILAEELEL